MPSEPASVAICTRDLMTGSRLLGTARAAGRPAKQVPLDRLAATHHQSPFEAVVVDLGDPDGLLAVQAAAQLTPRPRIFAVGPHLDAALLQSARLAGADQVLPHSAADKLASLLAQSPAEPAP